MVRPDYRGFRSLSHSAKSLTEKVSNIKENEASKDRMNDKRVKEQQEKMKIAGGAENVVYGNRKDTKRSLQQKTGKIASEKNKEIEQKKKGQEYMKKTLKKKVGR